VQPSPPHKILRYQCCPGSAFTRDTREPHIQGKHSQQTETRLTG
jgi:hypothetical protein